MVQPQLVLQIVIKNLQSNLEIMADSAGKKTLKEWLQTFEVSTEKIHELVRSLSFAGIAIIWVFKNGSDTKLPVKDLIPDDLENAMFYICLCLILDLLSYVWKAINIFAHWYPKEQAYISGTLTEANAKDIKMPKYIGYVGWVLFLSKLCFLIGAYINILYYIKVRV